MPFVIDVDPVAFSVLGFPVRWYGPILVIAAAVAIWLAQREGSGRGIAARDISDAVIWVGIAAVAAVMFIVARRRARQAPVSPLQLEVTSA